MCRLLAAATAFVMTGCGAPQAADSRPGAADLPRFVMTGPDTGYAVWPSGVRWIVLGTQDGWRTVANRTPVAVPTDGGLVLAASNARLALGVLPFQALTVSPVLTSDGTTRQWVPSQLPSALAPSATAVARSQDATWAVLVDGSVLTDSDGTSTWTSVTSAHRLDPSASATLTGVTFPGGSSGFLTASRGSPGPSLFVTDDSGRTWHDSGLRVRGTAVSSWPPCRIGSTWAAPVQVDDHLVVLTADQAEGPWSAGPALPASGDAIVSCTPSRVVASVATGGSDALYSIAPGGSWAALGTVGRHLVTLTAVSDTSAFAADSDPGRVLEVSLGAPVRVSDVPLPDWVATIGGAPMRN